MSSGTGSNRRLRGDARRDAARRRMAAALVVSSPVTVTTVTTEEQKGVLRNTSGDTAHLSETPGRWPHCRTAAYFTFREQRFGGPIGAHAHVGRAARRGLRELRCGR